MIISPRQARGKHRESWKRSRVSQGGDRGFERCYCTMTALNRADVKERLQARRAEILEVSRQCLYPRFVAYTNKSFYQDRFGS
jgi:hypothetical protein